MTQASPHYRSLTAWLVVLGMGVIQIAVLAAPLALAISVRPALSWVELVTQLANGAAPWAAIAAIAGAVLLGTPAGMALWRIQENGVIAGILLAPALLPITLVAQNPESMDDIAQLSVMLASHAGMGLAFGAGGTLLALLPLDGGMLRAAACCGLSPLEVYLRLMLPLALRGVAAGVLLAGVVSLFASLGQILPGVIAPWSNLLTMPKSPVLAVLGLVLLVSAFFGAAVALLKRP